MKAAYYNEIDPYAAQWLRNLIAAGHIAPGDVDERSIEDVHPDDLRGYVQCHFFAGIGIWSYALRRAGWADDRPVWTGSCPCQPFSAAGKGIGFDDERHLWPAWFHLISERRPGQVFGEQVASADGLAWLDVVCADLEGARYAIGPVDFCAAGVGAPHLRQRLYFTAVYRDRRNLVSGRNVPSMADSDQQLGQQRRALHGGRHPRGDARARPGLGCGGMPISLADHDQHGRTAASLDRGDHAECHAEPRREAGQLGNAGNEGLAQRVGFPGVPGRSPGADPGQALDRAGLHAVAGPGPVNGHWSAADWLLCRDGKWRPVEPGTFPLAHGAPQRVGRLRAYGNGIVAQAAEAFIRAAA